MQASESDSRRAAGPRGRVRLALAALLLLGLAAFAALLGRDYFTVGDVVLPDLVGLPFDEASRVLRSTDLELTSYPDNVPALAAGTVTSQSPAPGATVRRGRTVNLGVNTPPEATRVPTLVGLELAEAERSVAEINREIAEVTYAASDRTPGVVIAQEPSASAALQVGQPLRVTVSRGPDVPELEVPAVVGSDIGVARRRLEGQGFTRIEAVATSLSFDAPNRVQGQDPPAGSVVPASAPITLSYALPSDAVVQVPDLGGLSLWRAQMALRARGLRVGAVSYVQDPERPLGVVGSSPWTYTPPGTPVALTVNGEPGGTNFLLDRDGFDDLAPPDRFGSFGLPDDDELGAGAASGDDADATSLGTDDTASGAAASPATPGQRTVPFSFDPGRFGVRTLMDDAYRLELVVSDDRGERTVLDRRVPAGEAVSTSVTVYGNDALLQTFINGDPFQAWRP